MLVGLDAYYTYCYLLSIEEHRDGDTWGVRLLELVAQGFQPTSAQEIQALEARCRSYAADGRFELYKMSLKFDNPEARMAHGFPIDMQSDETKETVLATVNDGHPYPKIQE